MRGILLTRFVGVALVAGGLACARNQETGTAAVQDSTSVTDTSGRAQNPPGYRGIETDTTMLPHGQQPVDTFLQKQGTNPRADTAGYSGAERDTTGMRRDTTRILPDTSNMRPDSMNMNRDTTSVRRDTTGVPRDTTSRRP